MDNARTLYNQCPICDSENISLELSSNCSNHALYNPQLPEIINWMRCKQCNHSFTDGYFTDEALSILFSNTHSYQVATAENVESQRYVAARMIDNISSILGSQSGKWLDLGFGDGSLLITAKEYGFHPVGIDLRSSTVDGINKMGIEAHCLDFHDFEAPEEISVLSMADVLEHIPYPRKTLSHAHKL